MITFDIEKPSEILRLNYRRRGPYVAPNGSTFTDWESWSRSGTNTVSPDMPQASFASEVIQGALRYLAGELGESKDGKKVEGILKDGVSNGCFSCRRKQGEIVFSGYTHGRLSHGTNHTVQKRLRFYGVTDKPVYPFQKVDQSGTLTGNHVAVNFRGSGIVAGIGNVYHLVGDESVVNNLIKINATKKERRYHPVAVLNTQLFSLRENLPEQRKVLITAALADYNKKYLDLLTTVAEATETVEMISGALVKIARILKQVRRNHRKTIDIYTKMYEASVGSNRTKRIGGYRLDVEAHRKALKEVRKRRYKDVASGKNPASWWLEYRYGIMPLIYTIQDGLELLNAINQTEFVDSRKEEKTERPSPLNPKATERCTHRVLVRGKVRLDTKIGNLLDLVQLNPLVTAYELIPLSFVADWLINMGDALAAYNPFALANVKVTYSRKVVCQFDDTESFLDYELYHRTLIDDPLNSVSISYRPELSLMRLTDAASLIRLILSRN